MTAPDPSAAQAALLQQLGDIVGRQQLLTGDSDTRPFRIGFRYGSGAALAVVRPATLVELWRVAKTCVEAGAIMIMQASNTGLTGGSTPDGDDYDRDVLIISTLRLDTIHLIDAGRQAVCLPGATLFELEARLKPYGREPHSVIGSSCIGASVFGGVCNNSGGALIRRGPAFTELALYAHVDVDGQLRLINHLGIELGDEPESMLQRIEAGNYDPEHIEHDARRGSDSGYEERVRDIHDETPARYNADPGRLYQASGSAGRLVVFALRLDSFPLESNPVVFHVGSNDASELERLRRAMLASDIPLPIAAEYMHRDIFEFTRTYGKDIYLAVKYLGSHRLPALFRLKGQVDAVAARLPFVPNGLSEYVMQGAGRLFPEHLPKRVREWGGRFAHHLLLKVSNEDADKTEKLLAHCLGASSAAFFRCTNNEAEAEFLHRFAAASASGRYRTVHHHEVEDILALDVAYTRNDEGWFETLPSDIEVQVSHRLYYGHFFCHVIHQIYILKKGTDVDAIKRRMFTMLDGRGARYPAEHNVGHLYKADVNQEQFFRQLDPVNCLNPGIGQTSKRKYWH